MLVNINSHALSRLYNSRILWLMRQENLSRKCRFYYSPTRLKCPNCLTMASGLSGPYREGGPIYFDSTIETCPVCNGNGVFEESVVEEGLLVILFDAKDWFKPQSASTLPANTVMVIGDIKKTWDMIIRAEKVILDTDTHGDGVVFKLTGQPYPVGLYGKSRFFFAYLSQDGGA